MKIEMVECGSCRFWTGGECRRFPPQMILYPEERVGSPNATYVSYPTYPNRGATDAGCGEFKAV